MSNFEKETRTTCLVPVKMLPDKQNFMDLGFTFRVLPNSDLCLATLPTDWKSVADTDFGVNLIDEKGRKRGSYIYESNANNFIDLKTRFYISVDFDPDDSTQALRYYFVRDRANGRPLFCAGSYNSVDPLKAIKFSNIAKNFLNEHYPDWEDPMKYWNLVEDDIKYSCL